MSRLTNHLSTKAKAIIGEWYGPVIDPVNPGKVSYGGPNAHDTVYKLEFPEHAGTHNQVEIVGVQTTPDLMANLIETM